MVDLEPDPLDALDEAFGEASRAPTPLRVQPPPSARQRQALVVLAAAGTITLGLGLAFSGPTAALVQLFGAFLATYALVVASSWLPSGTVSARVDRFLDSWVSDVSSGFYGLVALASFGMMEAADLLDDLAAFDLGNLAIGEWLIPWLIGFSIDSVMNMIWSGLWPLRLASEQGMPATAVFAALAWGVFWLGSRLFPVAPLAARPKAGDAAAHDAPTADEA